MTTLPMCTHTYDQYVFIGNTHPAKLVFYKKPAITKIMAGMEGEGMVIHDPLLSNPRAVVDDRDFRTVKFAADIRHPDSPFWTIADGCESEVRARIQLAVARAMGLE